MILCSAQTLDPRVERKATYPLNQHSPAIDNLMKWILFVKICLLFYASSVFNFKGFLKDISLPKDGYLQENVNSIKRVKMKHYYILFITGHSNNPSLWVGTNGGHVFVYNVTVPSGEKRNEDSVTCILAKEIKLRHHAPVISIGVVDGKSRILPESLEVQHERAKAPDMSSHHSVIICSEEQLKVSLWRGVFALKKSSTILLCLLQ